uniref:Uncharacterized protein n=1 Tax=Kalanchoe fedtschenkoi TaxID=63787 RepID=A0A7N0ZUH1_KALFE
MCMEIRSSGSRHEEQQVKILMMGLSSPVNNQVKKIKQEFEDTRNPWLKQPEIRRLQRRLRSPSPSRLGLANRPISVSSTSSSLYLNFLIFSILYQLLSV